MFLSPGRFLLVKTFGNLSSQTDKGALRLPLNWSRHIFKKSCKPFGFYLHWHLMKERQVAVTDKNRIT
jgi:hypothetical protein